MASLRLQRVRELLKREIGEVIRREVPVDQAGIITVSDVHVSNDLHQATVFVSVLGNAEKQRAAMHLLDHQRKRIQGLVGQAVILKYTPQLRFVADESAEKAGKVLKIIEELERSVPDHEDTPKDH